MVKNSSVLFVGAFGNQDVQVKLSFVSGVAVPTYHIFINEKQVGDIHFAKLTIGGRPEVWRCKWFDEFKYLFTTDDEQILISIAAEHYLINRDY